MSDIPSWIGTQLGDRVGAVVGTVCDVYCDQATWRPAWLLVDVHDRFALVPADGMLSWNDRVIVPHDREVIGCAPAVESPPAVLAGELLLRLGRHYGVRVDRCGGHAALHGDAHRLPRAA